MSDCDDQFDFEVCPGRAGGLRIEIAPGNSTPDFSYCINLDERPFWVIAVYVSGRSKESSEISLHSENVYRAADWERILLNVKEYLNAVSGPEALRDVWMRGGYFELASEISRRPQETFSGIRHLVEQLKFRVDAWKTIYRNVYIFGI